MKKGEMSSLDLMAVINEIKELLTGAKLQKVYQSEKGEFYFYFYKQREYVLHIISGEMMHLTNYKKEFPQVPPHFCMFLRKYLKNAVLLKIVQPKSQRIAELHFKTSNEEPYILIFELFSKGNIVLCDSNHIIIQPLLFQKWASRTIKPKEKYIYPPTTTPDLRSLDEAKFIELMSKSEKADAVRFLAIDIGLGGVYSEFILSISGIDKYELPDKINKKTASKLYNELMKLVVKIATGDTEPNIIHSNGLPLFASPVYLGKTNLTEFNSFNDAVDEFFAKDEKTKENLEKTKKTNLRVNEYVKRYEEQKKTVEEYEKKSKVMKSEAELLMRNKFVIQNIISKILSSRKSGYSWEDILLRVKQEKEAGVDEAQIIKLIEPHLGKIIIDVEGKDHEFDLHDDVGYVINEKYEDSKKLEAKVEGAKSAMLETKTKIEQIKKEEESSPVKESSLKKIEKKTPARWYENYRWFISTDNYLVVSGKDASQNEILIRKYMELNDKVFHADIHGSPFTIVKSKEKKIPENTLKEAAIQTASYSKAWKEGLGNVDVYCVEPIQVKKSGPSGEYLARGSFMIHGKKNYFNNTVLEIAVGVLIKDSKYQIISGPYEAIKKHSRYFVRLSPGQQDAKILGSEVLTKLKLKAYGNDAGVLEMIKPSDIEPFIPGGSRLLS